MNAARRNNEKGKRKSKYFNVLIFQNIEDRPRPYKVSKKLFKGAIWSAGILSIIFFIALAIFTHRYIDASKKLITFDRLKKETANQKLQIELFAKTIKNFEAKIVKLENFDKKLRTITSLQRSEPLPKTKKGAVGGPDENSTERLADLIEKNSNTALEKLFHSLTQLQHDADSQILSFVEIDQFLKEQSTLLSSIPTLWPIKGWVTSSFGYRRSPFTGARETHEGLDIAASNGALIKAPADGIVIREGTEGGYGKMLEIDHGYGFVTRYGHNSRHLVKIGEKVKRGQPIATVGNTGRSTGPHLHYEVALNGVPVNPSKYILEED